MPFILRKIRKAKWYKNSDTAWLQPEALQGDVFGDLQTSRNQLSVWRIFDDRSNLGRVAAALASTQDDISVFDYALVLKTDLDNLGFKFQSMPGNTKDKGANEWHIDLIELTAHQLYEYAKLIQKSAVIERISENFSFR